MEKLSFSELDLQRSILRGSLYEFVQYMWDTVVPETPVWNWHIPFLCDEIQTVMERIFRWEPKEYDEVVNISPGTSKSTVLSIMAPAWAWTRMPSFRFLGSSYSGKLSNDLGRKCRDVVQSEKYQHLFPEIKLKEDVDAKYYFANTRGGIRYSVGTGGTVTGFHFHMIGIDDPIDPVKVVSEAELANANHYISQTLPGRKVDKSVSVTFEIMQRLRQGDPTDEMLKNGQGKVRHVRIPATLEYKVEPPELKEEYIDGLMDPIRLPQSVLDEDRRIMGNYGFAGQHGQDPVPAGGGMFKIKKLNYDIPPLQFKRVIRSWDKASTKVAAGTKNRGAAFTAGVKMARGMDGRIWILHVNRFQLDSWQRERAIRRAAVRDGLFCFVGLEEEPGGSGKDSSRFSVKGLEGFKVRVFPASGSKEDRADPFSVQVNAGNVWIAGTDPATDPNVETWIKEYVNEMEHWPFSTYLDQIDASAHAFNFISKGSVKLGGAF